MDNRIYDLELLIAKLLRYGVICAGLLMLVGWCTQLPSTEFAANPFASFATYHPQAMIEVLKQMLKQGDWGLLISYSGLVVLIALPFLRVSMTAVLFYKQKELVLGSAATFVCMALIASVLLGLEL